MEFRGVVTSSHLRSLGFTEIQRSLHLFNQLGDCSSFFSERLSRVADPDLALLQLVYLKEKTPDLFASLVNLRAEALDRLLAVLGGSRALGDYVIAHPSRMAAIWSPYESARRSILTALGVDPLLPLSIAAADTDSDDLRIAYRSVLLNIAATDLTCPHPVEKFSAIGAALTELADAALEGALALARRDLDPHGVVDLAVIAMGKTGAFELNYISDVDVIYVVQPGSSKQNNASHTENDDREIVEIGTRLASFTAAACSGPGNEAPLWTLDVNLRPEGRDGALVRTIDSYRAYYSKWAQNWEYQALLKARACAGNRKLGQKFEDLAASFIWDAAGRPGFVDSTRAMRRRVEESIPHKEISRELKLGRGGLRDVEFTVQLLQLVHGRVDSALRVRNTLTAIDRLSAGGYMGREDASLMSQYYCLLRTVEHRAQLFRMRRTHMLPSSDADLRIMARSLRIEGITTAEALMKVIQRTRGRVRSLHEDVYYRPIIAVTAQLTPGEAALDEESARARLAATGYIDTEGALAHIRALIAGTSRRATIQRNILPAIIEWLSRGADPDLGLLSFRSLSEQIGGSHWYLSLLRDSGVAAYRLCKILSNSRWVAEALSRRPEAVAWLDDDRLLVAPSLAKLESEMNALIDRYPNSVDAVTRIRAVRFRELLRCAMADCLGGIQANRIKISQVCDAILNAALKVCRRELRAIKKTDVRIALIGMGRYGGLESSYGSDADLLIVHSAQQGSSEEEASAAATYVAGKLKALLGETTSQMSLSVDMDLRPEGRSGPMSRTIISYTDYYGRWADTWERQALLRARIVAGDIELGQQFIEVINPLRYREGLKDTEIRDIRLLKARMESERLPRGAEPARHVKLGPGGLSDVEWTVQLMQLKYAASNVSLQTTSTLEALKGCQTEGYISAEDCRALRESWEMASRIRAANVLASGRSSGSKLDQLPREHRELTLLAHLLGYESGNETDCEEVWLKTARKSREIMEKIFWE